MQIVLKGVSAPRSSAGRNMRFIEGTEIPDHDTLAFFDFSEGAVGAAHPASYDNLADGPDGTVYGSHAAPTRVAAGIQIDSVNGFLLNTGVSAQRSSFVTLSLARFNARPGGNTSASFMLQHTASDPTATIPTDPAAAVSSGAFMSVGCGWVAGANSGRLHGWGPLFSDTSGAQPTLTNLPTTMAQEGQYYPLAVAVDGPTGRLKVHTLQAMLDRSDSVRGDTRVRDFYVTNLASRGGNFLMGIKPSGAARLPSGPLGNIVCAGVLGTYQEDDVIQEMLIGMAKLAVARGLTVAGYTP